MLLRTVLFLGAGYLVICIIMMAFERALIFFPSSDGDWRPSWLEFEDAHFQASDGVRLHGWYLEHPQAKEVLLFAHGNAGNAHRRGRPLARPSG